MAARYIIKISIVTAAGIGVLLCIVLTFVYPAKGAAYIDYGNGSWLRIEKVTFGTNHVWRSGGWKLSCKELGFFSTCWGALRNQFVPAYAKVTFLEPMRRRMASPGIALWGSWDGAGEHRRVFRYVLVDESGASISTFQNSLPELGLRHGYGLLAVLTNPPSVSNLRIRIYEETKGKPKEQKSEFVLKNRI